MKYGIIAALAVSFGLAGCSMLPGGAPAPAANAAPDYTVETVSANRYRITYTGPEDAKPAVIADRARLEAPDLGLYEAAQVAWRLVLGFHDPVQVVVVLDAHPALQLCGLNHYAVLRARRKPSL